MLLETIKGKEVEDIKSIGEKQVLDLLGILSAPLGLNAHCYRLRPYIVPCWRTIPMNKLEIIGLHVETEGKEIIKGITITFYPGKVHALMSRTAPENQLWLMP